MSAELGEFVSEVKTLKQSGQLGRRTAARLEHAARATAAGAARLRPMAAHGAAAASTGLSDSQASTAADPATITTPAPASTPSQISGSGAGRPQPGANPAQSAGPRQVKQESCSSPLPHHHHHAGNGLGHDGFGGPQCQGGHRGWSSGGNDWQGGDGGD